MKAKSSKNLVIKEICSWLQTICPSNPGGKDAALPHAGDGQHSA